MCLRTGYTPENGNVNEKMMMNNEIVGAPHFHVQTNLDFFKLCPLKLVI